MPVPSELSSSEADRKLAFYGGICLFLSTIEFLIPKPLPFFRIGLANLPILLAIGTESPKFILSLVGLKIFGQALVNGTLFSYIFLFSTVGSLASALGMLALAFLHPRYVSLVGISVFGALCSNLAQILVARYFLLGEGAWLIGPPFIAIGIVTGILLGVFSHKLSFALSSFSRSSSIPRERGIASSSLTPIDDPKSSAVGLFENFISKNTSPISLFIVGFLSLLPFLFMDSLLGKGVLTGLYILCAILSGKRLKVLPNLIAFVLIVAANLTTPVGKVLTYLGTFPLTTGALQVGVEKALTLLGMIALSRFTLRTNLPYPGRLGKVIAQMFFFFERITEEKLSFRRNHFWEDIKTILKQVYRESPSNLSLSNPSHTKAPGYLFLFFFLSVSWMAILVP